MQNAKEFSDSVQPQYIRKHMIYAFCPSSQTEIHAHSSHANTEGKLIYHTRARSYIQRPR
jgi:hypothetical protein